MQWTLTRTRNVNIRLAPSAGTTTALASVHLNMQIAMEMHVDYLGKGVPYRSGIACPRQVLVGDRGSGVTGLCTP